MIFGYARVSTREQKLAMQVDALKNYGCEKIITEKISGANSERPLLDNLLNHTVQSGDVLVIWKLDRLGRNLKNLITIVNALVATDVGLVSLNDPVDTTTPHGKLIFNIFGSLAEFERDIIRARTQAGLQAARARGKLGGRPKGLSKGAISKAYAAETLYKENKLSIAEICKQLNIARATLYSYLRYRDVKISPYNKNSGQNSANAVSK